MQKEREIAALELYYEVAQKEIDRTNAYFDQIDNKLNITLALILVIPISILGFSIQGAEDFRREAYVFWGVGLVPLAIAMHHIIQAVRIRETALGIPLQEFKINCETYNDEDMKIWTANILFEASQELYEKGKMKAEHLRKVLKPALWFLLILVIGTFYGVF